ncbi:MAG TPA: GpE family phage tail protein [Sphingopyxis sp.]|nr:GpE family phage tail protein [Sphingopyxis sp.]
MCRGDHRFFSDIGGQGEDESDADALIADIAFIFHWPLADLLAMDLHDLIHWHRLAVERWNKVNEVKK